MASSRGFEDLSSDDDSTFYLELTSAIPPIDSEAENHNLIVLALHSVAVRVGWLFKTESVIIPAFLDQLSGAGWVRGLLPVLHRLGGSAPPILFAHRLTRLKQKKWAMLATSVAMAVACFMLGTLPVIMQRNSSLLLIALFLAIYTLFWVNAGLLKLAFGTLQAKMIRPHRRGQLLRLSMFVGTIPAIVVAWWLLAQWLRPPDAGGFTYIFWFASACFLIAGLCALALKEDAEEQNVATGTTAQWLRGSMATVRRDVNFRWTITISMLLSSSMIALPHYQAMARDHFGLGTENWTTWVVIQSIGTGLAGLIAGTFADRLGNRIVLRLGIFVAALTPALAAGMLPLGPSAARQAILLLFFTIGFLPPTLRILTNYVLEISPQRQAARYLGILAFGTVLPFALSPVVGWWIDQSGFQPAFISIAALLAMAAALTFVLQEPRTPVDIAEMETEFLG